MVTPMHGRTRPPIGASLALVALVVALSGCAGIINNDPDLRWFIFSKFGASQICPEMIKTSVPIRLQDRAPSTGRFFPQQCNCAVDDTRRVITVSVSGTGYGYVLPAKRVGFALSATVEYRPDFVIAGKDLYLWAKVNRMVDGPRFHTGFVENPILDVMGNMPPFGGMANNIGNQVVSSALTRGFTVIRNDDNPKNPDFTLGILYPPMKPNHPFRAASTNRFTFANDTVDVEANQRDYLGPFEVVKAGQAIFLSTQVQGPPIDVLIVNKLTGDVWRDHYQTGKPLGPPPGPVLAGNPVMPGMVDTRRHNLPPGLYYVVIDNTAAAGTMSPAAPGLLSAGPGLLSPLGLSSGGSLARVSYIAQLGE